MTDFTTSKQYGTGWKEVFFGGHPEAEARLFATFTDQVKHVQAQIKEREHAPVIRRAFHAKMHVGITNHVGITGAEFRVLPDIPEDLRIGFFQPSAIYQATVRFSNASGAIQPDATKDLRGVSLRVVTDQGNVHDFLMTDAPASHARDARQFMVAAEAMASRWKVMILPKLLWGLGLPEDVAHASSTHEGLSQDRQPGDRPILESCTHQVRTIRGEVHAAAVRERIGGLSRLGR